MRPAAAAVEDPGRLQWAIFGVFLCVHSVGEFWNCVDACPRGCVGECEICGIGFRWNGCVHLLFPAPVFDTLIVPPLCRLARSPSRLQLLLLDFTIVFLQFLLITITFETSLKLTAPADTTDPILASPQVSPETTDPLSSTVPDDESLSNSKTPSFSNTSYSSYMSSRSPVVDIRLRSIKHHLTSQSSSPHLPLPATASPSSRRQDVVTVLSHIASISARHRELMELRGEQRQLQDQLANVQAAVDRHRAALEGRALGRAARRVQRENIMPQRSSRTRIPGSIVESSDDEADEDRDR